MLTNQPDAPKGQSDSDAYSHFSFVRTLQDMFQLADVARAGLPAPPPPPPKQHWEEDAGYLRGADSPIHPADDHAKHIAGHEAFKGTPAGMAMEPTAAQMHDQHIRNHRAAHMEKTAAGHEQMMAIAQQQGGEPMPEVVQ